MINLPTSEVMTLRAIRKTAALLMLFLRVSPLAVTVQDVCAIFGIDEKTATKQMQELVILGKIVRNGYRDGYILAEGGKQISLDALLLPQMAQKINETGESPVSGTLVVEDININSLIDDSTETGKSPVSSENTFGIKEVLKLTPGLFEGSMVSISGIEQVDPMEALRWIAYAYKNRARLEKPCGLIYARLRSHTKAPEGIEIECLPRMALISLGIKAADEESVEVDENEGETPGEKIPRMAPDESVTKEIIQLWATVVEKMRAELPRASFSSWVEQTRPVKYNGAFWVGAHNEYACDWLESRLTEKIGALLAELGHNLPVKWVVLEDEYEQGR